ncbi:30S ribosomal protein S6 [mine drainage metagenome]|uniref:30S ribosomal protein S6 n=1 Tax=mine drainage metagenome TaxID=410659 RepID=T1BXJ7_9ZZZZ
MTELRHYEVVFLVHPDQSEQVAGMLQRYQTLVENGGGRVHRVEDWGRRQLSYTIHKLHKAHYALMNIECDGSTLAAFQEAFRFNDVVLRHLIIRREEALVEPTTLLKDREEKDAREREQLEQENQARRQAAQVLDGEADTEGESLPSDLGIDVEPEEDTGDEADSDLGAFTPTQH